MTPAGCNQGNHSRARRRDPRRRLLHVGPNPELSYPPGMADVIDPEVSVRYDFGDLLAASTRARSLLRRVDADPIGRDGEDRMVQAARALCAFYRLLVADELFWQVAASITDQPQPEITELFVSIDSFEQQEYALLRVAKIDEATASELTGDLAQALAKYRAGSLPAAGEIKAGVEGLRTAVCHAERSVRDPARRRVSIKLLMRSLKIAGAAVGAAINIAVGEAGSVVAGLTAISLEVADYVEERQ